MNAISARGTVVSGCGKMASAMLGQEALYGSVLGWQPYPGTLNLRCTDDLPWSRMIHTTDPGIALYRCLVIDGSQGLATAGALIRSLVSTQKPYIMEVLAPLNLRAHFKLQDGDELEIVVAAR